MSKKQLSAAQGLEAACILFQINSKYGVDISGFSSNIKKAVALVSEGSAGVIL